MDPAQQAILAQFQRPGWAVTGSRPETKPVRVADVDPVSGLPTGAYHNEDQPTGNDVWEISPPSGQPGKPDKVIVASSAHGYVPIQGPSEAPPTTPAPQRPPEPNVSASAAKIPQWDTATSTWQWVDNPNYQAGSTARPPEPSVSTAAQQIPRWNDQSKTWDWVTNPNYVAPKAAAEARPAEPPTSTTAAQIPQWNGSAWTWVTNPNYVAPKPAAPNLHVINNQLVDDTGKVVYDGSKSNVTLRDTPGGGVVAIDPSHLDQPPQVIIADKPPKAAPPSLVPGQKPDQRQLLQQDPTTGALSVVNNPLPPPPNPSVQQWQQMQDGITQIQGMMARGEIGAAEGQQYVDALHKNFQAALQGTTPYQQYQDQQTAALTRSSQATSLLNQRVSAGSGLASSLVNSAVGIASNKNFMDPSAVAGLSIFGGANNVPDFINQLGGGQGTLDAATGAAKAGLTGGSDPASAFLNAALGGGSPGGAPAPAQPSYGGENIGSGAARNPQPPVAPIAPVAGVQPVAGAVQQQPAFAAGHMAPTSGYDPAAILLQAALRGGLQSY